MYILYVHLKKILFQDLIPVFALMINYSAIKKTEKNEIKMYISIYIYTYIST